MQMLRMKLNGSSAFYLKSCRRSFDDFDTEYLNSASDRFGDLVMQMVGVTKTALAD
jgi:hypothetical protein